MLDIHLMENGTEYPHFTVLVTTDQRDGLRDTLGTYRDHLDGLGLRYEVLAIINGEYTRHLDDLRSLLPDWPELTVLGQRPWVGEDAALATGLRRARGDLILLLPGWPQIDPSDLPVLFEAMEAHGHDMVSASRTSRPDGGWQGIRKGIFARVLKMLFGTVPSDPFCRARLVRRSTLEDATNFGVRQHFLPIIAAQRGHLLGEVSVRPASEASARDAPYVFKPLGHLRALLDALALYVVLKFLRRPLRFFGAIGLPIFLVGAITTSVLVFHRLFGETALADRPALIFAVMMVVLGIQILAIGLVGEIIIFAGAQRMKQYDVAEIITSAPRGMERQEPEAESGLPDHHKSAPSVRNTAG
ncbi:glycosyltransferase [Aquicoccus sp.]|uniref:glycosyltransferase n=1 Tax=Aquicoccus sp. TaxID=2055851 RepID=UPI003567C4DD